MTKPDAITPFGLRIQAMMNEGRADTAFDYLRSRFPEADEAIIAAMAENDSDDHYNYAELLREVANELEQWQERAETNDEKATKMGHFLRKFVDDYNHVHWLQTADFHGESCDCIRCTRDKARAFLQGEGF